MTAPKPKLNPTLGAEVVDWIETYLVHGPGDVQETPIELDDEFRTFIYRAYEVYPKNSPQAGRRVYPRAFLSRPKGRAKSELAGMLCCVEALGPVRFAGWRGNTPIGAPVVSPIIKTLATEESQAGNTFDNAYFMLQNGAAAGAYGGLDVGLTRINLPNGGSIEPVTSASKSKDGGKETFVVADEVHLWTTPELHRLYATITRNITKRKIADGWLMVTSTMYAPGEGSVAESIHAAAKGRKMPGLLWDHLEAPADTDITDDVELRKALEYVYGSAAPWTNIDGIIENEFHDPTKSAGDNRRYWRNQPAKRADRLFDPIAHKVLERPGLRPDDGTEICVGFDGAENRDSTALIGWTVAEVPHRFTIGLWERPHGLGYDDWHVPRAEVDAAVYRAFRDFKVKYMVCDPAYWQSELSAWDREFGEVVVKVNTRDSRMMVEAVQRYQVALAEGRFTHDGDPDVQRHLDNMAPRDTRSGIVPIKATRNEKIDAGMATLLGFWGLSQVPPSRPKPRIINLDDFAEPF
jgi:phage terminase large subunit-like protein